jgi:hypothetical protein
MAQGGRRRPFDPEFRNRGLIAKAAVGLPDRLSQAPCVDVKEITAEIQADETRSADDQSLFAPSAGP